MKNTNVSYGTCTKKYIVRGTNQRDSYAMIDFIALSMLAW